MEQSIILIIISALIFSAFFSGMEIAFVSHNRLKLQIDLTKGKLSARIINFISKKPSLYIATMLVGNNIALVIYGLAMADLLEPTVQKITSNEFSALLIQTIISTLIILFFAEFLPKNLFRLSPNLALNIFAPLVLIFFYLFYPITTFTIGITNFFIKTILKRDPTPSKTKNILGRADLDDFIARITQNQEGQIDHEIKIIKKTLDFDKIKVRECMRPRNEIVAVPVNASIDEVIKKMAETGLSRILVYQDNIDNIIGYIHTIKLFELADKKEKIQNLKELVTKIPIVPETMTAKTLLDLLIKQNKSIALVVDEYGGTSGIVTIEDILEEIFGEIKDETEKEQLYEQQKSENEFIFSGRMEIDYINEKYGLNLPTSETYETIAGLILHHLERMPEKGEKLKINNLEIEVLEIHPPKIEKVKIKKLE